MLRGVQHHLIIHKIMTINQLISVSTTSFIPKRLFVLYFRSDCLSQFLEISFQLDFKELRGKIYQSSKNLTRFTFIWILILLGVLFVERTTASFNNSQNRDNQPMNLCFYHIFHSKETTCSILPIRLFVTIPRNIIST